MVGCKAVLGVRAERWATPCGLSFSGESEHLPLAVPARQQAVRQGPAQPNPWEAARERHRLLPGQAARFVGVREMGTGRPHGFLQTMRDVQCGVTYTERIFGIKRLNVF